MKMVVSMWKEIWVEKNRWFHWPDHSPISFVFCLGKERGKSLTVLLKRKGRWMGSERRSVQWRNGQGFNWTKIHSWFVLWMWCTCCICHWYTTINKTEIFVFDQSMCFYFGLVLQISISDESDEIWSSL